MIGDYRGLVSIQIQVASVQRGTTQNDKKIRNMTGEGRCATGVLWSELRLGPVQSQFLIGVMSIAW